MTIKETNAKLVSLKAYGLNHNIPIIQDQSLIFLFQMIQLSQPKHILEIGTAIGYSAIAMALYAPYALITTIEKNPAMTKIAKTHINQFNLAHQIHLVEGDALTLTIDYYQMPIDLLFIDAAKANNIRFFERYEPYLSKQAIVIVDNVLFHNLSSTEVNSKPLKKMLVKLEQFRTYIIEKEGFDSAIYAIGDGISLSIKKV